VKAFAVGEAQASAARLDATQGVPDLAWKFQAVAVQDVEEAADWVETARHVPAPAAAAWVAAELAVVALDVAAPAA